MVQYLNTSCCDLSATLANIAPYRAVVIVDTDEIVEQFTRDRVSKLLCETGCRYMMAWGRECSHWDTAVDLANIEQFDFGEVPDTNFVMTTWHANETLDHVFWFAKQLALNPYIELEETVLVHFGDASKKTDYLQRFSEA